MGIPLAAAGGGDGGDDDERRRIAAVFFEKARAVADDAQYEFAIEMYLSGLRITPEDIAAHRALREIALKRKASGGKDLGFLEKAKLKKHGADDVQNLLNAEKLLAYDPGNTDHMVAAFKAAQAAGLNEVATWLRGLL